MLGVEEAHFAFAVNNLVMAFVPEFAVLKTGFVIGYLEPSLRYFALALISFGIERPAL